MKKICLFLICALILCGCSNQKKHFENLKNSKKSADKIYNDILNYNDNSTLIYENKTSEKGFTFYHYKTNDDVDLNIIFDEKKDKLHCVSLLDNPSRYFKTKNIHPNYDSIRKGIFYAFNIYDKCANNNYCNSIFESNDDVETIIDKYKVTNYSSINSISICLN